MFTRIFTVLIIFFTFISCSTDDEFSDDKRELSQARQKWSTSQILNYTMNERISCFCGGLLDWNVFVEKGIKVKVVYDESQAYGQTYESVFDNAKTVEDTFDFIESLLVKDLASLIIDYDDVYGFPKLISIDYVENIADDEIAYLYTDFKITN